MDSFMYRKTLVVSNMELVCMQACDDAMKTKIVGTLIIRTRTTAGDLKRGATWRLAWQLDDQSGCPARRAFDDETGLEKIPQLVVDASGTALQRHGHPLKCHCQQPDSFFEVKYYFS